MLDQQTADKILEKFKATGRILFPTTEVKEILNSLVGEDEWTVCSDGTLRRGKELISWLDGEE